VVADEANEAQGRAKGGLARAASLSGKERSAIAQRAAEARWSKDVPHSTHEGVLAIGDASIPCAVLNDKTRVLTQLGFLRALGRGRPTGGSSQGTAGDGLPAFLSADNLKPFISEELRRASAPIVFRSHRGGGKGGNQAFGYTAELLPQVCNVYLEARQKRALSAQQRHVAEACEILIRALAHVGIIALVDEATGYEEVRDKLALQAILDAYLRKELAAWAKRFPDDFYRQIFRLRNWQWKGMKVNRPQVVANYTKDFVYARLAPGILEELQVRMPKDDKGRNKGALTQLFTEDVGHPALAQHLHAVTALMTASRSWDDFKRMINVAFPKKGANLEFNFVETDQ